MTRVKTKEELEIMQEGGRRLAHIRDTVVALFKPGAIPLALDYFAQQEIKKMGGTPSFLTVRDYKWATCVCVNDVVVHGIPTKVPLQKGDVVTLDIGILYKGFHTDTAWTVQVGTQNSELRTQNKKVETFLKTGQIALERAIAQARGGNRIGHISQAFQRTIEGAGYSVVPTLVGHGIGEKLHETPHVPGILIGAREATPLLMPGMTFALEIIYTMGSPKIVHDPDGWTIRTLEGSLAAVFEHTVAITDNDALVLTKER